MSETVENCDFTALGQAIKKAREANGWTREQVAGMLHLVPRYIQSLENEGQHPSLQVLYRLVTLFNISIDEYLLPNREVSLSTRRRQIDVMLDALSENDLIVVEGTVQGICKAKERTEE
ncbi:MAG: helix-turn-helix domain-containing protein [Pseudoruminococcus massiliensis]|uniref:helix-turn-helix domain-containing protein n=1 Tax=Pseudoruminococcus massiliensis TaxID=2086583 RepID=UPI0039937580